MVTGPALTLVLSVCSGMCRIVLALHSGNWYHVCEMVAVALLEWHSIAALSRAVLPHVVHGHIQARAAFTDEMGQIPGRGEMASVEQKSSCSCSKGKYNVCVTRLPYKLPG